MDKKYFNLKRKDIDFYKFAGAIKRKLITTSDPNLALLN